MIMEKKRTHLTPEEVQEFINLGVDFGETADIWIKVGKRWDRRSREFQSELDDMLPEVEAGLGFNLQKNAALSCPNLQEVLEVLPKQVKAKGGIYQTLRLECYSSIEEWSAGYGIEIDFTEINILDACTELLRWVCRNHPETLTKTE